jgi:MerR family mercuric resistance operon transcriptional regulator
MLLFQGLLQEVTSTAHWSVNSVPNPRVKDILAVRSSPASDSLTIGRLARAADVGVETIRYYQDRQLLPVPASDGAFRHYPLSLVDRIRFIKRAQELGFSLEEVRELLQLEDGADRVSIRRVAGERLSQIEVKLADLKRMQRVLKDLLTECEHTRAGLPCPIIGTIRTPSTPTSTGPRAAASRRSGLTAAPRKTVSVQEHRVGSD